MLVSTAITVTTLVLQTVKTKPVTFKTEHAFHVNLGGLEYIVT